MVKGHREGAFEVTGIQRRGVEQKGIRKAVRREESSARLEADLNSPEVGFRRRGLGQDRAAGLSAQGRYSQGAIQNRRIGLDSVSGSSTE